MAKTKQKRDKKRREEVSLTDPLTMQQAVRQAKRVARMATRPEKREIKREIRASELQADRIKDYFRNYQQEAVRPAAEQSAAGYATAQTQIADASKSAAGYAEELRQRLRQEGEADAELRGASYNPEADTTDVSAQLSRVNAANILGGVTAAQGASQASYYADKGRIGKREKIEQLLREKARQRSYDSDLRNVAKTKGDLIRDEISRLRDSERDYALGKQAARTTKRGQKIDARQTAAAQAETRRHNQSAEAISQQNANTSAQNAQTSAQNAQTSRKAERRQRRQDRYERRHPDAEQDSKRDPQDVQRAGVLIRQQISADPKFFAKRSRNEIIDAIQAADQTLSRAEVIKAYNRNLSAIQRAAAGA